jgi:hypothetical protein
MPIADINALLEYSGATEAEWDAISVPISVNMLAYAKDTKQFKIGDGTNSFSQLPVAFSLDSADSVSAILEKFPEITAADAGKFVIVNADGTGYDLSDFTLADLATIGDVSVAVNDKALLTHDHDDVYATPEEASTILNSAAELDFGSQDLVSYLLLNKMEEKDYDSQILKSGYADEFLDGDMISSTNMTLTDGAYIAQLTDTDNIVSTSSDAGEDVSIVRMLTRISSADDAKPNEDYVIESSRDGGATWAKVDTEKSRMSTSSIDTVVGTCEFDSTHTDQILSIGDIEDLKGDIVEFTVDTVDASGHFGSAINSRISAGCKLSTDTGLTIDIIKIVGDGTGLDSVLVKGAIPVGTYTVTKIFGLVEKDVVVGETTVTGVSLNVATKTIVEETVVEVSQGVAVPGGTAIGPYTFKDGQTGYIVVPSSSVYLTTKSYGYYNVNTDNLGLACNTSSSWTDPYTGLYNTEHLCTHSGDDNYTTPNNNAVHYCNNLVHDGCNDYFLPNVNELLYIYENRSLLGIDWGSFYSSRVWSSSQYNSTTNSWCVNSSGGVNYDGRHVQYGVVPVRRVVGNQIITPTSVTYDVTPTHRMSAVVAIPNLNAINTIIPHEGFTNTYTHYTFQFGNEYKIYKDSIWKTIARLNGTTWEYKSGSIWYTAQINTPACAVSQAVGSIANQMTTAEVILLTTAHFTTIPDAMMVTMKAPDTNTTPVVSNVQCIGSAPTTIPSGHVVQWRLRSLSNLNMALHGVRIGWA